MGGKQARASRPSLHCGGRGGAGRKGCGWGDTTHDARMSSSSSLALRHHGSRQGSAIGGGNVIVCISVRNHDNLNDDVVDGSIGGNSSLFLALVVHRYCRFVVIIPRTTHDVEHERRTS